MKRAVLGSLVVAGWCAGCWSGSVPSESSAVPEAHPANPPSPPTSPPRTRAAPIELHLVEGTPSTLPDGTTIDINHVVYAHMTDGQNLSAANLIVERDGQRVELGLNRHHSGPAADAARTGQALGWELVLDQADPYQQPSRAIVFARKLP